MFIHTVRFPKVALGDHDRVVASVISQKVCGVLCRGEVTLTHLSVSQIHLGFQGCAHLLSGCFLPSGFTGDDSLEFDPKSLDNIPIKAQDVTDNQAP